MSPSPKMVLWIRHCSLQIRLQMKQNISSPYLAYLLSTIKGQRPLQLIAYNLTDQMKFFLLSHESTNQGQYIVLHKHTAISFQ